MADPKTIDEALLMLQSDPPVLTKNKDGQVGNQKTKYADLVQVNAQVLSRLNALGVVWKCCPDLLEPDYRFVLRYELRHVPSGTAEKGTYPLKGENAMQQGSSITYARRYCLLAVTGIAAEDEDDDGDAASGRQTAQRSAARPRAARPADTTQATAQRAKPAGPPLPNEAGDSMTAAQRAKLMALFGAKGIKDRQERLDHASRFVGRELSSANDMSRAEVASLIDSMDVPPEDDEESP